MCVVSNRGLVVSESITRRTTVDVSVLFNPTTKGESSLIVLHVCLHQSP